MRICAPFLIFLCIFCLEPFTCLSNYCCEELDRNNLWPCIKNAAVSSWEGLLASDKEVVFVTEVSNNILDYAQYTMLLNINFSQHYGYPLWISSIDHHPQDRRWNKIKTLADLLQSLLQTTNHSIKYILYFDADYMFLNADEDVIEKVIAHYRHNSHTHLILTEDSLDFANSGMMIIKVTEWSQWLMQEWWDKRGLANTFCDQHVLNTLSLQLQARNQLHHLAVLPYHTLNSFWPALEHFDSVRDGVLHLLGEFDFVRQRLARGLALHQCSSINQDRVTTSTLLTWKLDSLQSRFTQLLAQCDQTTSGCEEVLTVVQHTCEMHSSLPLHRTQNQTVDPSQDSLCDSMLRHSLHLFGKTERSLTAVDLLLQTRFLQLKHSLSSSSSAQLYGMVNAMLRECEELFGSVIDLAIPANQHYLRTLRHNLLSLLVARLQATSQHRLAIHFGTFVLNDLTLLLSTGSAGQLRSLQFIEACDRQVVSLLQLRRFEEARQLCDVAVTNGLELMPQYSGEVRLLVVSLREVLNHCIDAHQQEATRSDKVIQYHNMLQHLQYYAPRP